MKANAMILGLSLVVGALGSAVPASAYAATAQNINISGTACKNYNASEALDIDYLTSGVRNLNASPRSVVCPIARHPVTGPGQAYYVDGSNYAGASTTCTVSAYDYNGTYLSSTSFTRSDATYSNYTSLPTVSYWGYTSVLCTLPGGANGVLFGASAIDS
ncbi:hypothetical protein ACFQ4Q_02650 [Lysobacter gummosus]|jgi:hypothetical protein